MAVKRETVMHYGIKKKVRDTAALRKKLMYSSEIKKKTDRDALLT